MGPIRNKKNNSKAVSTVPKTNEERRQRFKSRKIVPAFDQLFLTGDENKPKTPNCAKKGKNGKSGTIFKDSLADLQLPPPSTRKPLATKNDNTSCGTSSHSSCSSMNENDTFDNLLGINRFTTKSKAVSTALNQVYGLLVYGLLAKRLSRQSCSFAGRKINF